LLEFARKRGAHKARRDLEPLVNEAVHLLRPLSEKRGITLALNPRARTVEAMASVDPAQFEQVITNLVMNAIQAMPGPGTINVTLSREFAAPRGQIEDGDSEYLCVRVQDEGGGIADEHLPHIFEPFYTTKDVGEGTGLGLSVSYGIIEEHGGWIEVVSEMERGSTFSVFLPPSEAQ
jgi:signal transduction histidine kinase